MEHPYPVIEFEARVTAEGMIPLPSHLARSMTPGSSVIVRLTHGTIHRTLRKRGVSEGEIEHIASLQLEPRENVVRFLAMEGTLSRDTSFLRRVQSRGKAKS
jgi:hypothetical protein